MNNNNYFICVVEADTEEEKGKGQNNTRYDCQVR